MLAHNATNKQSTMVGYNIHVRIECETRYHHSAQQSVPKKYKRVDRGIGAMMYKVNQCPRTILDHLCNLYSSSTPNKKTHNKTMWTAPYNPSDPIEDIFDRLEECFVVAIVAKPAYSTEKTVDKALIAIQFTSLYSIAIL